MVAGSNKVGCAGIIVADTICGPIAQLPAEGQLTIVDEMPTKIGGCAANVAVDLAKQGVDAELVGCVGNDPAATALRQAISTAGVGCDAMVSVNGLPTSTTVILLVEGEDRRFIHTFGANTAFGMQHVHRDWLGGLGIFYLGGLFVLPSLDPAELVDTLTFCREHGVVTVVDVVVGEQFDQHEVLRQVLPHTDYFLPNDDEARRMTGKDQPLDQLRVLAELGAAQVIITCGEDGCIAASEGRYWRATAHRMDVIDPSGCGDAFASGVITALGSDAGLADVIRYASAIGAAATQARGTTDGVCSCAEAKAFVQAYPLEVESGVL